MIGPDQFGTMILDNLRKAGIQARDKKERLKFDTLEPFAGEWLHASGEFTDAHGDSKRVAICIGPEYGTVGPELLKEAAQEALRGVGFDLLYVVGFAFDPHVDLDLKNYGKLRVEICRMNPDLSMGDELLKKTGAGNLFMVLGEPDIVLLECGGSTPLFLPAEPLSLEGTKARPKGKSGSAANQSGVEPPHSKSYVVEIKAWTFTTRRRARSAATPPTTSPAGSSTPTTTARVFLFDTLTSQEPSSRMTSSSVP